MKKTIGIFIVMLLILTAIPSFGMISEIESFDKNELNDYFEKDYFPGELIVKFKTTPSIINNINNLNNKYHVRSIEKLFVNSERSILDNIYILRFPEDLDLLSIMNDYSKDPNVIYAELNGLAIPCVIPNDPDFDEQWYFYNTGQFNGRADCDIDAPEIWDILTGSSDIIIAIIDSGIDYTHPDLADNIWINEDEVPDNEIDDDENGYIDDFMGWDFAYDDNDPKDLHGHGTVCAGVVGAKTNNNIGLAGLCWNSKIMNVQISNETWIGWFTDIAQGIKYAADNDADIISMSFGWINKNDNLIENACDYAYDKGVFLVAGAGNNGLNDEFNPAHFENVLAVAGTDNKDSRYDEVFENVSYSSNYGPWVDIAAPAEHIYTTMPTYSVIMNVRHGLNLNYEFLSGTSLASPIVAGVVGLILSKDSTLNQEEIKSIICKYSDPYKSIYDLGDGRVNAYRAVEKLKSIDNINPFIIKIIIKFPILKLLIQT